MSTSLSLAARAAKLSYVPGVTLADACDRFDVSRSKVLAARKDPATKPTLAELALAALTANGTLASGSTDDFAELASWIDYVNHDGCTADEARALVASRPEIAIDGATWTLVAAWP